jgi:hypothetical protein
MIAAARMSICGNQATSLLAVAIPSSLTLLNSISFWGSAGEFASFSHKF